MSLSTADISAKVDVQQDAMAAYLAKQLEQVNKRYFGGKVRDVSVTLGLTDIVQVKGVSATPAACARRRTRVIIVNWSLPKLKCPKYVYRYLLFHEILHFVLPLADGGPVHSEEFRAQEARAPHRLKAIKWLKRNCFSVMEIGD